MKIPKWLKDRIKAVTGKRPRTVLQHILAQGFITTEELKNKYGYNHPPRAARDVRELGILLETFKVTGTDGRKIAAYRLLPEVTPEKVGRRVFSKEFKAMLLRAHGARCAICSTPLAPRYLQIDHRIPYEVLAENREEISYYMLLCGSCNRAKSWSCEQCGNWGPNGDSGVCGACYWASPLEHSHVAGSAIRRLDLVFRDADVPVYESLKKRSGERKQELQETVLDVLRLRYKSES